jgi:hypothetical protein
MRRHLASVLAIAVGVACGDATGPATVAGTYTLQTVGGSALPLHLAIWSAMGTVNGEDVIIDNTLELTSGTLRFDRDATFAATHVYRTTGISYSLDTGEPVDTAVTTDPVTDSGTFTVTGTSVQMTFSDGTAYTGSLSGDLFTISWDGVGWVYGR